jgi:hypothetical protein
MCRWLKQNKMVGLGTRSGKLILMPAESVYGPSRPIDPVLKK